MALNLPDNRTNAAPIAILAIITAACLIPFAGKAFNIDEPLFLWVARQIQAHPLDFYGFRINWYGTEMDAARIIKNPPLAAYYLALAGSIAGWGEIPLHLAFLLPSLAAALGTYFLAGEFTRHPLPAALIAILNPAFMLSGTTVMCDTMMLAFFVWAVFFWIRGLNNDAPGCLALSALLTTLCCITKYFGLSLLPLLCLHTLAAGKGKRHQALYLLIPVAVLSLYQWGTWVMYGRGLLSDAASYATGEKSLNLFNLVANLVTGVSFTGGCLISTLFFAPQLWSRRVLLIAGTLVPLSAFGLGRLNFAHHPVEPWWGYYLQLAAFSAAGISLLSLTVRDFRRGKDAEARLLALWMTGTFLFAAVVNWSVNGRSILPMAPVAGIIVMRAMERRHGTGWLPGARQMLAPLAAAWLATMAVTWSDFTLAATARSAAAEIGSKYGGSEKPLWFQGHWGFQYYMEKNGGTPYDRKTSTVRAGDIMVLPENNTNAFPDFLKRGTPLEVMEFAPARFLTTMNFAAGAGYYSSSFGPVPFLVDKGLEERYHIVVCPPPLTP